MYRRFVSLTLLVFVFSPFFYYSLLNISYASNQISYTEAYIFIKETLKDEKTADYLWNNFGWNAYDVAKKYGKAGLEVLYMLKDDGLKFYKLQNNSFSALVEIYKLSPTLLEISNDYKTVLCKWADSGKLGEKYIYYFKRVPKRAINFMKRYRIPYALPFFMLRDNEVCKALYRYKERAWKIFVFIDIKYGNTESIHKVAKLLNSSEGRNLLSDFEETEIPGIINIYLLPYTSYTKKIYKYIRNEFCNPTFAYLFCITNEKTIRSLELEGKDIDIIKKTIGYFFRNFTERERQYFISIPLSNFVLTHTEYLDEIIKVIRNFQKIRAFIDFSILEDYRGNSLKGALLLLQAPQYGPYYRKFLERFSDNQYWHLLLARKDLWKFYGDKRLLWYIGLKFINEDFSKSKKPETVSNILESLSSVSLNSTIKEYSEASHSSILKKLDLSHSWWDEIIQYAIGYDLINVLYRMSQGYEVSSMDIIFAVLDVLPLLDGVPLSKAAKLGEIVKSAKLIKVGEIIKNLAPKTGYTAREIKPGIIKELFTSKNFRNLMLHGTKRLAKIGYSEVVEPYLWGKYVTGPTLTKTLESIENRQEIANEKLEEVVGE